MRPGFSIQFHSYPLILPFLLLAPHAHSLPSVSRTHKEPSCLLDCISFTSLLLLLSFFPSFFSLLFSSFPYFHSVLNHLQTCTCNSSLAHLLLRPWVASILTTQRSTLGSCLMWFDTADHLPRFFYSQLPSLPWISSYLLETSQCPLVDLPYFLNL